MLNNETLVFWVGGEHIVLIMQKQPPEVFYVKKLILIFAEYLQETPMLEFF